MEHRRHRGGQPGNHNAIKHGFYSRELNKEEMQDFNIAAGMEGIEEEIALLRYKIKRAVTSGEISDLIPLSKIIYALEKLIRTNHKVFARQDKLSEAMRNVYRDILVPIGGWRMIAQKAHKDFPDEFPPVPDTDEGEETNNTQNEPELS